MKHSFSTLLLVVGVFSLAVSAQNPFTLRVWRRVRWPEVDTNPISHRIEIESGTGNAIINKTANYPGFPNSIFGPGSPYKGSMYKLKGNQKKDLRAYLYPLTGIKTNPPSKLRHYQLRYSKRIPKVTGVLYTNFTHVGRDCGAMCGGSMLDYGLGGNRGYGEWYVIPVEKSGKTQRTQWELRWIGAKSNTDLVYYPEGAYQVYLWKEGVA